MKISEIFYSVQGEGRKIGTPAIFIRTAGCNLSCKWCDTDYSLKASQGEEYTIDKIVEGIEGMTESKEVVITGGEPLIQKGIVELVDKLREKWYNIQIETNGTIYNRDLAGKAFFTVSPKLSSSGQIKQLNIDVLRNYSYLSEFKFVIGSEEDKLDYKEIVDRLKLDTVTLVPEGTEYNKDKLADLVEWTKVNSPNARVIPRMHIMLYGNKRGK